MSALASAIALLRGFSPPWDTDVLARTVADALGGLAAAPVALADADATILLGDGSWRRMAARTAPRVIRLSSTGAANLDQLTVTCADVAASTVTVLDNDSSVQIGRIAASRSGYVLAQFNGTAWQMRGCGEQNNVAP